MLTQGEIAEHLGVSRKTVNKNRWMFGGCITLHDCEVAYQTKANHSKINNKKVIKPKSKPPLKVIPKKEKEIQDEVKEEIFKGTGYIHDNIKALFERLGKRLLESGDEIDISEANDTKVRASSVAIILKGLKDSGKLIDRRIAHDEMSILMKYWGKVTWEIPKKIGPALVGKTSIEIEKMIYQELETVGEDIRGNFERIMEERFETH